MNPSVLISLVSESAPKWPPTANSSLPRNASGLIVGVDNNGDTLLVTTATWLVGVVELSLHKSGGAEHLYWKYQNGDLPKQKPNFIILVESMSRPKACQNHDDDCVSYLNLRCIIYNVDIYN